MAAIVCPALGLEVAPPSRRHAPHAPGGPLAREPCPRHHDERREARRHEIEEIVEPRRGPAELLEQTLAIADQSHPPC